MLPAPLPEGVAVGGTDSVRPRLRSRGMRQDDSCGIFGITLGALGLRFRDVFLVSNVARAVLLLLTGPNVPRETLPGWMRTAGDLLPLTQQSDERTAADE